MLSGWSGSFELNQEEIKMAGHGGARPGAGRPAGAPNTESARIRDEIAYAGLTPLEFMLRIMRDEGADEAKRLDAAKAAAPYVHPRLNATTLDANVSTRHEDFLDGCQ